MSQRLRTHCRLNEKLSGNARTSKPALAATSDGSLSNRLRVRRRPSEATLVPEFTFSVSPDPTVVLNAGNETKKGDRPRRSLRSAQRENLSASATPTTTRSQQQAAVAEENQIGNADAESSTRKTTTNKSARKKENKSILEDLTNNGTTPMRRSTRRRSIANQDLVAKGGKTKDGTTPASTEVPKESEANHDEDVPQNEEEHDSPTLVVENVQAENEIEIEIEEEHVSAPTEEQNSAGITEAQKGTTVDDDQPASSPTQEKVANEGSDVQQDEVKEPSALENNISELTEGMKSLREERREHTPLSGIAQESHNHSMSSACIKQTTQETTTEIDNDQDLSFETREIRKKICERLEESSNDEDSLCGEPPNCPNGDAAALFDTLLQANKDSPQLNTASTNDEEHEIVNENVKTAEVNENEEANNVSDGVATGLVEKCANPVVLVQRLAQTDAARLDVSDRPEDNLTLRFEQLRKGSTGFKQPLPAHMAVQKHMASASLVSFTSDEGGGTFEIQNFAGAAVRQALTILEDPAETADPHNGSVGMNESLQEENASEDLSIDSDADIDVLMQSKCVGTSRLRSSFHEGRVDAIPTPRIPSRREIGTSMTVPFINVRAPFEEQEHSLDLVLDDEQSNQTLVNKPDVPLSSDAPQKTAGEKSNTPVINTGSYRFNNATYIKSSDGKIVRQADNCPGVHVDDAQEAAAPAVNDGEVAVQSCAVEVKQEPDIDAEGGTCGKNIHADPIPEEEEPDFLYFETKELRNPRKSKLESTRLLDVDAIREKIFVISDDEVANTEEVANSVVVAKECEIENVSELQQIQDDASRNDIAVGTGPSLFESRRGEPLTPDEAQHQPSCPAVNVDADGGTATVNNTTEKQNTSNNNATELNQSNGELNDPIQTKTRLDPEAAEGNVQVEEEIHQSVISAPDQIEQNISAQVHVDCGDTAQVDENVGVQGSIAVEKNELMSYTAMVADSSNTSKTPQNGGSNSQNNAISSVRDSDQVDMGVTGNKSLETSNVTSRSFKTDPFRDRGDKGLKDLIGYGLLRMPFLGFDTTPQTITTPSPPMRSGQQEKAASGTPRSAQLLNGAPSSQTPRGITVVQRYRIAESKPFEGGRKSIFSPQLPLGEGEPIRRRYLFQEDSDEARNLLPEQGSPPAPPVRRRRAEGFMLDSNRLPQFNDSYIEIECDASEVKVRGEELFAEVVKHIVGGKPNILKCVRRALEDRILPNYESHVKEIMALMVKKAALGDQFKRCHEAHQRQQSRLEHARNFVNATVSKLLPEGENDVVKVLGFNPYDGQLPPPESIRQSTIRQYSETETCSQSKRRRTNSP